MLGFRRTVGTQEIKWPTAHELLKSFNRPHTQLSVEERQRLKSVSKLTVGARALQKHSHRSSDGFWGNPTGTEDKKNEQAKEVARKILAECVWINVHTILKNEILVEARVI